jgi:hypothetical protein
VDGYGGQPKPLCVFSRLALGHPPGLPPVALRYVLVAGPAGTLRLEAFCCPDLQATPVEILQGVVMRWSVEVTCEEARAHLGVETQRQGRTKPSPAPLPSCWRCSHWSPCWPCRWAGTTRFRCR